MFSCWTNFSFEFEGCGRFLIDFWRGNRTRNEPWHVPQAQLASKHRHQGAISEPDHPK